MPTNTTPPSLDALLASFHSAPDSAARTMVAMALVRTRLRDDRILAALVRLLHENPVGAAACLARHGDARAIPDLLRAFDSDELVAKADCAICAEEILGQIAHTIERLGGTLTEAQRARRHPGVGKTLAVKDGRARARPIWERGAGAPSSRGACRGPTCDPLALTP